MCKAFEELSEKDLLQIHILQERHEIRNRKTQTLILRWTVP